MNSPHSPTRQGDLLWQPDSTRTSQANLTHYSRWLAATKGLSFSGDDYSALWRWSVDDLAGFWDSISEVILAKHPNKEFVRVEQMAAMVTFLCSEAGAAMTGAALSMDGGWTAV